MSLGKLPGFVQNPDPSIYEKGSYVVLDFETTTGLKGSPHDPENRIVLTCWQVHVRTPEGPDGYSKGPMRHVFGGEYDLGELARDIERTDFVIAHNAKFELGWLRRIGIDLRDVIVFDTLTADYVLGGNRYGLYQLGLNACLKRHGLEGKEDTVSKMIKAGVPVEDIPEPWLLRYCERDVEAAGELFRSQLPKLKELGLEGVAYQRNLVTPALADIEFNGVYLDNELVRTEEAEAEERYAAATRELEQFCNGIPPSKAKQLAEFVYADLGFRVPKDFRGNELRTATGQYSVAAEVMEKLVAKTAKQEQFLSLYRQWSRMHSDLTKYLRKFGDCVRMAGGELRASFNQCSTRTHRLSCNGLQHRVQLQNLSRRFKPLFTAREDGWFVGEADGAQLEFRVAAHLGRDRVALRSIVRGEDVHQFTASIIGCSRQDAKAHTFKPLYGGGSGSPAEREYYAAFKRKYQGIADTQQGWTQQVLRDKFLVTEWGLRYYWPDTKMTASGWITNTTSIFNYPVQALATAEIIPCALVCAWHRMKDMRSFLVNTVHDSLIAELHPDEVDAWHKLSRQCLIDDTYNMIHKLYGVAITVPLGAGVTVGTHWASPEAKDGEVVYQAEEHLWKTAAQAATMISH